MTNATDPRFPSKSSMLLVLSAVAGCLLSCTSTSSRVVPQEPVVESEIVYGKAAGVDLLLDLARPAHGNGPFPAVIYIHGGGWREGSRAQYEYDIQRAAARGYVAVTVDYRLTADDPSYIFPAQVNDVKCAVRWLRANAAKYHVNPERIAAMGFSAGGHLALMLGLTGPTDGLEGDEGSPGYSSAVQAVVNSAGPTDLSSSSPAGSYLIEKLLGGAPQQLPDLARKASPVTYVRSNSPPILTINGDLDGEVPLDQARGLDARMHEAGASHTLLIKEGKGHEDFLDDPAVWDFLAKTLK